MSEYIQFSELKSIIGIDAALFLSYEVGGTELYISSPQRMTDRSKLARLIGLEMAVALATTFGSGHVIIPSGPGRRALIWKLHEEGRSKNAIALKVKCSVRTVYNALNGARPSFLGSAAPK
ncbi:helix-turn-helix domain-containing protein [Magnetospirillum fulvum]|uniref:Helix-turn-helix domain of resolvase n=1 Tax=Magnetospirillum fulvum TaxID=1082 RepID=A0A1H6HI74_MAGFU|nr:helix-turn-helix domain-containing protein [Magnetospirillum fulvum]SEH35461.1 Helix-turn-helix domain of resolvase [Magnetospirillum fulvum]